MEYDTMFFPKISENIICNLTEKIINNAKLSRKINITQASSLVLTKSLEEIQLINIDRGHKKRSNEITLTDKGIKVRNHFLKIRELLNG